MNNKDKNQKQKKQLNAYLKFSGIAFQMIAIIGLGVFIGYSLDEKTNNSSQTYTIIFSLFFIAASLYYVISKTKEL